MAAKKNIPMRPARYSELTSAGSWSSSNGLGVVAVVETVGRWVGWVVVSSLAASSCLVVCEEVGVDDDAGVHGGRVGAAGVGLGVGGWDRLYRSSPACAATPTVTKAISSAKIIVSNFATLSWKSCEVYRQIKAKPTVTNDRRTRTAILLKKPAYDMPLATKRITVEGLQNQNKQYTLGLHCSTE